MDFSAHASLLSAVLCTALATAVAVRHRVHNVHRAFFLLALSLAAWNAAYFAYLITWSPGALRVLLVFSFTVPPAAIHFLRRVFYFEMPTLKEARRVSIWASLWLGLMALVLPNHALPLIGVPALEILIGLSSLYLVLALGYITFVLHQRQEEEPRQVEKTRYRYLRNGAAVVLFVLVIEAISAPFGLGFHRPRLGAIALTAYAYFVYLSILNFRLLELQEFLGRALLVGVTGGVLAGFYALLASFAGGSMGVVYLYAFVASLVVLILYQPVRDYLERNVYRLLFRKTYELKEATEVLSYEMLKTRSAQSLVRLMLSEFARLERVTHTAAFLYNPRTKKYQLSGARGSEAGHMPASVPYTPLVEVLERDRRPLLRDDLEVESNSPQTAALRKREILALLKRFDELHAELIVPLLSQQRCLGFFIFQDERAIETYTNADVRRFVSIAGTAAVLLENFRAYEELRERERLASVGEMAAGLAHEIRNPLGSIKGAVQYLEDEVDTFGKAGEFFQVIVEETDRLSKVVSDFLDYSRNPILRRQEVDLADLAERTLRQLELDAGRPHLSIRTEFAPGGAVAVADPDCIKQVLINLLQNAVSVLPEGGEIRVRTGEERSGDQPVAWVAVADTGPGMDEETASHVFTPFFTTREGGSGLGLSICHRIVETHGGQIDVRTAPGEGAEFLVKLPAARPSKSRADDEQPAMPQLTVHSGGRNKAG